MKVAYKNGGAYADYSVIGTVISFRGGELSIDLALHERDHPVRITVSEDENGRLVIGPSRRYVAEIGIPARTGIIEKTGVCDAFGFPVLRREQGGQPCTEDATLTLWALADSG